MDPYRKCWYQAWEEDDLYQRLDQALERAFSDPHWSWGVAWQVARDGARFPELVRSAVGLMHTLQPLPPDWDLP